MLVANFSNSKPFQFTSVHKFKMYICITFLKLTHLFVRLLIQVQNNFRKYIMSDGVPLQICAAIMITYLTQITQAQ